MWQVVTQNLVGAIGLAASVMAVVAMIVTLTSKSGRVSGPLFALGWFLAVVAGLGIAYALGSAAGVEDEASAAADGLNIGSLLVAALFFFLSYKSFKGRPTPGQPVEPPGWLSAIDNMSPIKLAVAAFLLVLVNAKNLSIFATIGGSIAEASLSTGQSIGSILVIAFIGTLGALIPLGLLLIKGDDAGPVLARWRSWLIEHNAVVMGCLMGFLGLSTLSKALPGLGS